MDGVLAPKDLEPGLGVPGEAGPVEQVARTAGYDSSTTMRAQFTLHLQTSPRAYRRTFRA